jgi:DNA-binding NtrC family response regulator
MPQTLTINGKPCGDGQRVLVVDDEELLLTLAARTLDELGYAPVRFASSTAALEAFRAEPGRFDAIVTDERMPGLSGSVEAGADEVLKKPLRATDLAMGLARVLRSR